MSEPKSTEWIVDYFKGDDVFIVGGGPSLHGFDFNRLNGKRVIVLNHSYLYCEHEILIYLDNKFVSETRDRGHDLANWPQKVVTGPQGGIGSGKSVTTLQYADKLSKQHWKAYSSKQSGLFAINFALLANASRIFLLGFDARFMNGMGHYYSDKWKHNRDSKGQGPYSQNAKYFDEFSTCENIYNCSGASLIKTFPYVSIDEILIDTASETDKDMQSKK